MDLEEIMLKKAKPIQGNLFFLQQLKIWFVEWLFCLLAKGL